MKTNLMVLILCASALGLQAAKPVTDLNSRSASFGSLRWNSSESHWDRILRERPSSSELRIGKSDFVIGGPLFKALRYERMPEGSSVFKRMTGLPILGALVPQKMPMPPGGTGRYIAWRNCERPWGVTATMPASPPGASFNGAFH